MWRSVTIAIASACVSFGAGTPAGAATIAWKGHTWQLTSGGMAGVCQGDPQNVTIDANGYLHLRIVNNAGTWTASELFTTDRLGFGTYQWQVDGPIDTYDKDVVLGLFPYGPAAGIGTDGTNEIDIEYSRWGQANGPNGDWTDYPASGTTVGELSYTFSLGGATLSTSRFTWSSAGIASTLLGGLEAVNDSTGLIKSWTYAPANPTTNIPQQALPLGINLWCFDSPPSDGNPVEIVIRDFVFVAANGVGGAGGSAGGSSGVGGRGGASGTNGAGGRGGASGTTGGGAGGHGGTGGTTTGSAGASGTTGGGAGGFGGNAGIGGTSGGGGTAGIGAGGTKGAASGGESGGGGSSVTSTPGSAGCSCAIGVVENDRYGAQPAIPLGLAFLALARRRRRTQAGPSAGRRDISSA
jgi:hypothetical protein